MFPIYWPNETESKVTSGVSTTLPTEGQSSRLPRCVPNVTLQNCCIYCELIPNVAERLWKQKMNLLCLLWANNEVKGHSVHVNKCAETYCDNTTTRLNELRVLKNRNYILNVTTFRISCRETLTNTRRKVCQIWSQTVTFTQLSIR
jgi:hypothetical protein